ncbi:hypothetical protein HRR83_002362 [Exophiala dermatitidis]|nr:hypothetical protein HRR74_002439 [Exophiala dermatitidis]KAJ4525485.1 hypothetical protein HRR73_002215 [Exophiala dermatitidis]KAJ4536801.1 hypothetical protein HRR76_004827 [Exophiala dermatitidis]KAJ4555596.1 hypothetical protein HRR77_001526 [Exophiala dermatitidis]KAJ4568900.1 hypothetical protein HRR81_006557 [Exophiala dermatitidis]
MSHSGNGGSPNFLSASLSPRFKAVKRHITRSRTSYSCSTCRRRKIKCDKIHPVCGGCRKANEKCVYISDGVQTAASTEDTGLEEDNEAKKRKISPISQTSSASLLAPASDGNATSTQLKVIEEQLRRLTSMLDALRESGGDDLRLRDLLTSLSTSSKESSHLPASSVNTPQNKANDVGRNTTDLSRPLSGLSLTDGTRGHYDPLWDVIVEELDELNRRMRTPTNEQVSSPDSQVHACQGGCAQPVENHTVPEDEDTWDQMSFHREAGLDMPDRYDLAGDCSVCQRMPFSKSTLLQGLPGRGRSNNSRSHFMRCLPTRGQSNVLLRCWLSGVYPIMPILDPTELLAMHEAFWAHLDEDQPSEEGFPYLGIMALMYGIWYTASLSISNKGLQRWFPHTTRAALASAFHDQVVLCLTSASFSRNIALNKVAALVVIISVPAGEEDPLQESLYMQLVIRLASTLGLHRDPDLFNISKSAGCMRRRLWWQIVQMDMALSVASRSPSQISEAFCDTRLAFEQSDPTIHKDNDQSANLSGISYISLSGLETNTEDHISLPDTVQLFARARSFMAHALRSVVSIHLRPRMLTNADMHEMKRIMEEAGDEISAVIKLIPAKGLPELGFIPHGPARMEVQALDCDQMMADPINLAEPAYFNVRAADELPSPLKRCYRPKLAAFNKWARISLSLLKDRLYCVAYAPFLKNGKSKLWDVGRQCALHNSHSFMRKFISLATDPDLQPFRWTWPAMHGPLHAVMIALVDLYERPNSIEAPRSRELVDTIFALAAPESGIVGGPNGVTAQRPMREAGPEIWDMLRGLRSAAWQRARLDPMFLWTVHDQIAVGVAAPLSDAQRIAQNLREDAVDEYTRSSTRPQAPEEGNAVPETTESGAEYLGMPAQNGIGRPDEPEDDPCVRSLRCGLPDDIENDIPVNGTRGLCRRQNQRPMPFLPICRLPKCAGETALNSLPEQLPQTNEPFPRSAIRARCSPGEAPFDNAVPIGETLPIEPTVQRYSGGEPLTREPAISQGTASQTPAMDTRVEPISQNDLSSPSDGYSSYLRDDQLSYLRDNAAKSDSGLHHDAAPVTTADLGFDWDRWDAVFGQYAGFTDLMQDVTWDDYVDE